jgi:hypothetical protein
MFFFACAKLSFYRCLSSSTSFSLPSSMPKAIISLEFFFCTEEVSTLIPLFRRQLEGDISNPSLPRFSFFTSLNCLYIPIFFFLKKKKSRNNGRLRLYLLLKIFFIFQQPFLLNDKNEKQQQLKKGEKRPKKKEVKNSTRCAKLDDFFFCLLRSNSSTTAKKKTKKFCDRSVL